MAIIKGAINFGSNFNIGAKGPIDARQRVETIEDLTTVWTAEIPAYKGMVVSVLEDNSIYILKTDDATVLDNWKRVGDATGDITNLQGQITANKTAIDKINGDASTTGSFAKGDADTLAAAKADATTKVDAVKGSDADDAGAATVYGANKAAAAAKDAADAASAKVDTEIGKLDVTGNTSEAVKGVTVTVDETDGKVIKPVVSIADGTLTGAATDGNLVTGTVVKKYVDDKVSDINTSAGALGERVGTLETKVGSAAAEEEAATGLFKEIADEASTARAAEKKNADAIAAEATRAKAAEKANADAIAAEVDRATAAEEKVKTDLLGDAAAEYNTLGKLEDKIQAEASRAEVAEQANAAAAAAAKTAADKAQATADAKVKSVEGTNTVIATTTEHAVSVSLKTSDKGNVKFTQDTDGLSANVAIPEATVTGVKSGDKVLALDGTELTSTISLSVDTSADGDGKKYIRLTGIGGADLGKIDIADFVRDGMLEGSALYNATAATGTVTINSKEYDLTGLTTGHTYIVLVWNTDAVKDAMAIDVTSLIDIYTAKADGGLVLEDHAFSVDYEKVAKKGDLDNEVTRAKAAEKANADAIANEVTRAKAAEAALLGTDKDTSDSDTIKGAKQAVKDLKAQIEADAVTLTIPEDDPYITASKDATTNKYTIKSKLDADGATPLVDVKIDAKLTDKINSLDVTGNTSEAVKGVTVTVDETDGKVITPVVSIAAGTIGGASDANLVTGDTVKTYVDTAITNVALVWNDIA